MASKTLPFSQKVFEEIADTYGTPVFVYDEDGIRAQAQRLNRAFLWTQKHNQGQQNFFAVKATPTPAILRVLHDEGMGFDCSSRPELSMIRQNQLGSAGISYSSNNTSDDDYRFAHELGAIINVDKLAYVEQVKRALGALPKQMSIRLNPGDLREGNDIIGHPVESKFGARPDQVIEALKQMREGGVERVGIHTMVISSETRADSFVETAQILADLVVVAKKDHDITIDYLNIGGGLGVSYHPDDPEVDVEAIGEAIRKVLEPLEIPIYTEFGRYITGPHGYLLTRVTHGVQETWQKFLEVDTSVNNMARLVTVKNAYHYVTTLGKESDPMQPVNIVGSMCTNSDKMLKNVPIPTTIESGDLLVLHDAGAHARANSHNYNSLLRAGEVLVHPDGTHSLIRRPETEEDIFATTNGL